MATLTGTPGNDTLRGSGGPDTIRGGSGDDRLYGLGGDDILRGEYGDDWSAGGVGNDYYGVWDIGDQVFERADEGLDTIGFVVYDLPADYEYVLPDNFENLRVEEVNRARGNDLDNEIIAI